MRRRIENQKNLWVFQQGVDDLIVENYRVVGVVTQNKYKDLCKNSRYYSWYFLTWSHTHWVRALSSRQSGRSCKY